MLRRFSILASLLLVLLLAPSHSLSGEQSGRKQDWDKILDSYSELCNECIELKLRSEAGEKLSQRSVSKLFARLEELRDNLSGAESQMSEEQRRRFESIKRRYLEAFSPAVAESTEKAAAGSTAESAGSKAQNKQDRQSGTIADAGTMGEGLYSGVKRSREKEEIEEEQPKLEREKVVLPMHVALPEEGIEFCSKGSIVLRKADSEGDGAVEEGRKFHFDAMALAMVLPCPGASLALGFGSDAFPVGAYLKMVSNFRSAKPCAYGCLSNGSSGEGKVWLSGEQSRSLWQLSGGASFSVSESLCLCAGLGYGSFLLSWEDISGSWVKVEDLSFGGAVIEAGAVWRLKQFSLGAFVGSTRFRSLNLEFGLGLRF